MRLSYTDYRMTLVSVSVSGYINLKKIPFRISGKSESLPLQGTICNICFLTSALQFVEWKIILIKKKNPCVVWDLNPGF